MFRSRGHQTKFLMKAAVALVAGCAWLATANAAFAQGQRDDSAIQSDVTAAISHDSTLQGQQITASVDKGVVKLSGTVQTEAQMQQAETDAANVSGISGILNQIKVSNPSATGSSAGLAAQTSANQVSPQDQTQTQPEQEQQPEQGQQQESVPPPPPDTQPQAGQYQQAPPPPANQGQRPEYQQGYGYPQGNPQQGQVPYYSAPSGPVTVPSGTLLRVRLSEPLDTANLKDGAYFQATCAVDVYESGILAIPRGALLTGRVVKSRNAGELGGAAELALQLTSVSLAGQSFPVATDVWSSRGPNKAGYTAGNTAGGAMLGAIIGGIIGRGAGAAVGAGVGAVGGLAASSASKGPRVYLPTETALDFHLVNPATVQPVSWQEAQRLASSAPPPALVQRPRPVYMAPAPYPYYGPYPYAYPYPY